MLYRAIICSGLLLAVPCARADGVVADTLLARADRLQAAGAHSELAIVSSGYDALLLRVHLIRQARHSIDVQTFIWTNDEVGSLMMYELIQAARRGVRVRIIADQMASDKNPDTAAFLATVHTNLQIKHYRPPMARIEPSLGQLLWAGLWAFKDTNQRMHNKLMLVDGCLFITGGRNIENTYYDFATELNFRDRDVLALGPVALEAAASFEDFWSYRHSVSSAELKDVASALQRNTFRRLERREEFGLGDYFVELDRQADEPAEVDRRIGHRLRPVEQVRFIADEPGKKRGLPLSEQAKITRQLRRALESAQTSLVLQTPYLVLSPPARKLFRDLKKTRPSLRIRISSNSFASTDNLLAYSANYRLRGDYVEKLGLEIYEFRPRPAELLPLFPQVTWMEELAAARLREGKQTRLPFLCIHAKSMVVDDRLAFVGTYNLDPRSENLNTEAGLLVEDRAFALELKAEIERDMQPENSWVIARRALPLGLEAVNGLVDGLLSKSPLDVWPIQNTSSFELKPGATEVPPGHPDFHAHFREAGSFPGTEGWLTQKEIITRLYKVVGAPLTPIL